MSVHDEYLIKHKELFCLLCGQETGEDRKSSFKGKIIKSGFFLLRRLTDSSIDWKRLSFAVPHKLHFPFKRTALLSGDFSSPITNQSNSSSGVRKKNSAKLYFSYKKWGKYIFLLSLARNNFRRLLGSHKFQFICSRQTFSPMFYFSFAVRSKSWIDWVRIFVRGSTLFWVWLDNSFLLFGGK